MSSLKKQSEGFTLIELLVVIAIIGILASVVLASLNSARAKARDATRKSDLKQMQLALEAYFQDNGRYPGPTSSWQSISGGCGGTGTRSGASGYIPNLAPAYIPELPIDPVNNGSCVGYLYNSDGGSEYKLLAHQTAESILPAGNPLYDPVRPVGTFQVCRGVTYCGY